MAAEKAAKANGEANGVLAALREAVKQASPEERDALASELGISRTIGKPQRQRTRRETNEQAQQMSRISGGASHSPDFVPAPPDWVVQHGGGMNTHEVETIVMNKVSGREEPTTTTAPIPGEAAYTGNWAVEIYRDRWLNNLPPLPTTQAYDAERDRFGSFGDTYDGEQLAATASMES
tara:strand:- start:269 stop:802 length:534 start_codon:yes stop_codon:yes gene_type:complete